LERFWAHVLSDPSNCSRTSAVCRSVSLRPR